MENKRRKVDQFQLDEEVLKISRICLAVFFTFITFGIFAPTEELGLYDPKWMRIAHSSVTLFVILLTYISSAVRSKIQPIMLVFFYTMSAHSLVLLYWNSLYIGYLVGMILVITCIGVSFVERRWLVHYLSFVVSAGILVGIYSQKPQVDLSLYLSAILTPAIVSYLTLSVRLSSVEKLRESQIQLKLFHDRISYDLELASETQNNLVTKNWPKTKGYKCSSFFRSFDRVGGDAISYVIRPDGKIVFFFADVSGHGIASAMVSAMAVLAFKMHALDEDEPASCLKAMHNGLKNLVSTNHISACIIYFSPEENRIDYSYAGHPAMLLLRANNKVEVLEGSGTLIVSMLELRLKNYHKNLESGDKLLLYSDGIIEVFNDTDEIFGEHALIDWMKTQSHLSGQEFLNSIFEKAFEFSNEISSDDMSMLLLEIE
jgi:hypothetical protein